MTDRERELIAALLPEVRAAYSRYRSHCETEGIRLRAIVTYRPPAVQAVKAAQGKSTQRIGWHQLRRAIDEQIMDPATGRWDDRARLTALWLRRARIAESHGFRQIGFTSAGEKRLLSTGAWDPYHIEFRGSHSTLVAAVTAEAPELRRLMG